MGTSATTLCYFYSIRGISKYPELHLNTDQESVLLGTVLGDVYIEPIRGGETASLSLIHGLKQREWLLWKRDILSSIFLGRVPKEKLHPRHKLKNLTWIKETTSVSVRSPSWARLMEYRRLIYPGGKKTITAELLSKITGNWLSLMTWFADDGSNGDGHLELVIGAVDQSQVDLVVQMFNAMLLKITSVTNKMSQNNTVRLHISAKSSRDMQENWEKYVPDCMKWKLMRDW